MLTGVIDNCNDVRVCKEKNFMRNLFVSNIIISFLWQIGLGYILYIGYEIFIPISESKNTFEATLILLLYFVSYLSISLIVIPLLMKLLRLVLGLRWLFGDSIKQKPKDKAGFMGFYNQNFIPYEHMFYTNSKKVSDIKKRFNVEHDIQKQKIIISISIFYIIVSTFYMLIFIGNLAPKLNTILIGRAVLYLSYNIFMYMYWIIVKGS